MFRPALPDYDIAEWRGLPFPERVRAVCTAWSLQGYGSPPAIFALYGGKIVLYVLAWIGFCAVSLPPAELGSWWSAELAFQKAILWTMLFEGLGLGCGSGPLTGRYLPPIGGALYFLRPGTVKLPLLPGLGTRRTWLDVVLYGTVLGLLLRALLAPEIRPDHLVPLLVLVPVLGVVDKTLFLVFRSEHYLSVIACLVLGPAIAGSKVVWLAIWWWAATSKLNRHFPAVMCVMVSNSPWVRSDTVKKAMYRSWPDDLRPSSLAAALAHFGTVAEYAFPLVLVLSDGGPVTTAALAFMVLFHGFILFNVPMGVPLEWNVVMVYGGLVLFGAHADVSVLQVLDNPVLTAWLVGLHVLVPVYGSLVPAHVSFLLSMRYYAGNWATTVWLFRDGAEARLDERIPKWSRLPAVQLGRLYDADTVEALLSKVVAFRSMHLHGRAVHRLVARAVDDIDRYTWLDGEIVAGMVVGWNFGDGHLHGPQLLAAVQERCGFEPGELVCVFLESQPFHRQAHDYVIADAAAGVLEAGSVPIADLLPLQPWPAPGGAAAVATR